MGMITDTRRGDWLRPRAGGWATAGGVAGTGFAAYARVLHPLDARCHDIAVTDGWGMHPVVEERRWRWAEVAARRGRHLHPRVQWTRLTGAEPPESFETDDGWAVGPPEEGQLDTDVLAALTEHLGPATTTPDDLVAAVWDGWGDLNGSSATASFFIGEPSEEDIREQQRSDAERALRSAAVQRGLQGPVFEWPGRSFHLMAASTRLFADPTWLDTADLETWPGAGHTPQMLWPEDRAWVLATEIDWDATIVAGSRDLVERIVADDRFEAFEVGVDDDLSWAGDVVDRA
ncbi:hypothetical protein [Curtobacterium flaccumfaciens]|uniref:hypothetical protein n=1 Tax=Curtobacterium flaccumfaciens TaxID=2035 RepID=UPI003EE641AF